MKGTPSSGLWVLLLLVAVGAVVFRLARRGTVSDDAIVRDADRTVVAEYVRLVGEGKYAEAWERCLTKSYRDEVPREKFVAAHEKRRAETGALAGAKLLRPRVSRNLFTRTRTLHLLYELSYSGKSVPEYAVLNDADGAFRIEGTYHEAAGETLDFLLW
ncbi:MAG TPA: hypothetical protein P5164_04395 [Thermoanaerobaculia bacterium]|nr:hypothetical protein [Thermoanaerobaculia bacterium]